MYIKNVKRTCNSTVKFSKYVIMFILLSKICMCVKIFSILKKKKKLQS